MFLCDMQQTRQCKFPHASDPRLMHARAEGARRKNKTKGGISMTGPSPKSLLTDKTNEHKQSAR